MVAFELLVCWSNAVDGLILAQLKKLGWTDNSATTTLSATMTAGMFPGAPGEGIIDNKTGRKNAFILREAIHITSMIVGAFSPNMTFLIACRFIIEAGLGALLVTLFTGFTEYMPGRNRDIRSSQVSFIGNRSYSLCSLVAMGLTPLISARWNWCVQLMTPAVLSLMATVITWRNFPESPHQLESRGHYAETEKVMQTIEEGTVQRTGKPLLPVIFENGGKAPHAVPYSTLLTGALLKRIILDSLVLIAMNVVQYTLVDWLPTIFVTQGVNLKNSIVLNTVNIFGAPSRTSIAVLVMDKIPRKTMGVGLLVLITVLGYIYSLQIGMLLITLTGFFLITFVYMYIYYASAVYVLEIWPTKAKLRDSGLMNAVGRISGIAAPYAVAVLLSDYGVTGVFVLLGAVSIIVTVAIATIGIETKGASVESLGIDAVTSK